MDHEHAPGESCVVCEEGWEAYEKQASETIKKFGWMLQGVGASDTTPPFVYSVGLSQFNLPEIILVGPFPQEIAAKLVNLVGFKMRANGAFQDWSRSHEITQMFSVVFRELSKESTEEYCTRVVSFFGEGKKVLQLFLPDKNGQFPWDKECEWRFQTDGMPITYASPDYLAFIN